MNKNIETLQYMIEHHDKYDMPTIVYTFGRTWQHLIDCEASADDVEAITKCGDFIKSAYGIDHDTLWGAYAIASQSVKEVITND